MDKSTKYKDILFENNLDFYIISEICIEIMKWPNNLL